MIFVTTGTQKFQFDRLIKAVDELAAHGDLHDSVFIQTGHGTYLPEHCAYEAFLDRDRFASLMEASNIVITHAGTGAIVGALKKGKKVIAMARLAKFGEHVDDHQVQLLREFGLAGLIEVAEDEADLGRAYADCMVKSYRQYVSNNAAFIEDLESYLSKG